MEFRCLCTIILLLSGVFNVLGTSGGVFNVQHKFAGRELSLSALNEHDSLRHGRMLSGVDIPLGGNGLATETGLYYGKIGIGSPPKDYYVHVDTGSDIFWVNCIECTQCPKKSGIKDIKLTLYDPHSSGTASMVSCEDDFCLAISEGPIPGCATGMQCAYQMAYGDGSSTTGYFVKDVIQYNRVTGNLQTTSENSSVIFGCGVQQTGNLIQPNLALDGLLGFGQAETSMISQLASTGKVKKMFAHCLDSVKGGGIFAMGNVVEPKVQTTPLVPDQPHYNVNMEAIEVGGAILQLPSDAFETGDGKGTIIDSGTTLVYLPDEIYQPLINKIMSNHSDLNVYKVEEIFSCFKYNGSVDDGFPTVTLQFQNSLSLTVYPHEYLVQLHGNEWCIGWQNTGLSADLKGIIILGDLVISNKLVVYDLEKQVIGWTNYNCSSTVGVQDENSGAVYLVAAHDLSSSSSPSTAAHNLNIRGSVVMLLLLTTMLQILMY